MGLPLGRPAALALSGITGGAALLVLARGRQEQSRQPRGKTSPRLSARSIPHRSRSCARAAGAAAAGMRGAAAGFTTLGSSSTVGAGIDERPAQRARVLAAGILASSPSAGYREVVRVARHAHRQHRPERVPDLDRRQNENRGAREAQAGRPAAAGCSSNFSNVSPRRAPDSRQEAPCRTGRQRSFLLNRLRRDAFLPAHPRRIPARNLKWPALLPLEIGASGPPPRTQ